MSAPIKRVVPWISRSEFLNVFHELFSGNLKKVQHAVDRIKVWKARSLLQLPVPIDCTFNLFSCELDYQRAVKSGSLCDNYFSLCYNYSLSIIRFVNHTTEKGQTKRYAVPVHVLASDMGVPQWIVDVRHSATHGHIPSLECLRTAVHWALDWLKVDFWDKWLNQESSDEDEVEEVVVVEKTEKADRIRGMFLRYQEQHYRVIQYGEIMADDECGDDMLEVCKNKRFKHFISMHRELSVLVFMEDGIFLSTREQLESLDVDVDEFLSNSAPKLPKKLKGMWKDLLEEFHKHKLIPILVGSLVDALTESTSLKNKLICCWMYHIVKSNQLAANTKSPAPKGHMFNKSVDLPLNDIFEECLRVPNCYGVKVIDLLARYKNPPLEDVNINKIVKLYEMGIKECLMPSKAQSPDGDPSTQPTEDTSDSVEAEHLQPTITNPPLEPVNNNTPPIYTLDDVKEIIRKRQAVPLTDKHKVNMREEKFVEAMNEEADVEGRIHGNEQSVLMEEEDDDTEVYNNTLESSSSIWKLCKDKVNWSECSVGILPNQTLEYQTLELPYNDYDAYSDVMMFSIEEDTSAPPVKENEETFEERLWTEQEMNAFKSNAELL